ncbi:MAG: hypothetical protein MUF43_08585 [Flavobacterium sp.]|jgi:hypothetical protein|nr:hypothetical protein [Flavobacterium sp.]
MKANFIKIKNDIQMIIDAMATKNFSEAALLLVQVSNELEELIDLTSNEETLVEISKYQLLLDHLQIKMSQQNLS